jgi:hypothetical protein
MTTFRRVLLGVFVFASSVILFAATDVIVLKGGTRIELQKPPVRQGSVVLLTRADGTLLSVPQSEIDWKATAAARAESNAGKPAPSAVSAPPETPAQAAKAGRDGPRARVKLTDADVQHPLQSEEPGEDKKGEGAADAGSARLEVSDYTQEKNGANLIVRGDLRNPGSAPAASARMTVTAMDEKGEKIASAEAGLSNGLVSPGASVSFSATIPVADRIVASLRFAPQWLAPPSPAQAPGLAPTPAPAAAAKPVSTPPGPTRTPYGQGSLYAPPPAAAPTGPPADGNRGYIPGMSDPQSQPKPPK